MEQFKTRLWSFVWRVGMMGIAATIDIAVTSLTDLNMDPAVTTVLGLLLGEASKWIRNAVVSRV